MGLGLGVVGWGVISHLHDSNSDKNSLQLCKMGLIQTRIQLLKLQKLELLFRCE